MAENLSPKQAVAKGLEIATRLERQLLQQGFAGIFAKSNQTKAKNTSSAIQPPYNKAKKASEEKARSTKSKTSNKLGNKLGGESGSKSGSKSDAVNHVYFFSPSEFSFRFFASSILDKQKNTEENKNLKNFRIAQNLKIHPVKNLQNINDILPNSIYIIDWDNVKNSNILEILQRKAKNHNKIILLTDYNNHKNLPKLFDCSKSGSFKILHKENRKHNIQEITKIITDT